MGKVLNYKFVLFTILRKNAQYIAKFVSTVVRLDDEYAVLWFA